MTFEGLSSLAEVHRGYPVRIALRCPAPAELATLGSGLSGVAIVERDASSAVVVGAYEGEKTKRVAMFDLTNKSSERLFVHLLSLEESRERHLISIPGQDPYVVLEPGETRSVPASIAARRSWAPERPMLDRYLVLAFPKRKLRDPFALESRLAAARGEGDRLPGLLERLIHGGLARGQGAVPLSPEGWGVAHLDVLVVPPDA